MAFYAGQIIKHPAMQNPTLVVLTDRNDLDDQLFGTFSMCKDLLRQTPIQAEDRDHLRKLLDRPAGGVIFTTLQKFSPEDGTTDYPALTDRRNVIVIADEAHRSQYGFRATVARNMPAPKAGARASSYGRRYCAASLDAASDGNCVVRMCKKCSA